MSVGVAVAVGVGVSVGVAVGTRAASAVAVIQCDATTVAATSRVGGGAIVGVGSAPQPTMSTASRTRQVRLIYDTSFSLLGLICSLDNASRTAKRERLGSKLDQASPRPPPAGETESVEYSLRRQCVHLRAPVKLRSFQRDDTSIRGAKP